MEHPCSVLVVRELWCLTIQRKSCITTFNLTRQSFNKSNEQETWNHTNLELKKRGSGHIGSNVWPDFMQQEDKKMGPCVFFGDDNIMIMNSYVIYISNKVSTIDTDKTKFCNLTTLWTCEPLAGAAEELPVFGSPSTHIHSKYTKYGTTTRYTKATTQPQGRKICGVCSAKKRRITKYYREWCLKAMRREH